MSAFRAIVVPVDFSGSSDAAVDYATALAADCGASIRLLHTCEMPLVEMTPYRFAVPSSMWEEVREAAGKRLESVRERVAAAGVEVTAELTEGPPADSIAAFAEEVDADVIVMGTHGHTGIAHVLLGSVAERTLRLAKCPVLTVRTPSSQESR